jgi:hypothetical protein
VNRTSVYSDWAEEITKAAQNIWGEEVSPNGISFNKSFPLMLLPTSRLANLKATDITSVSCISL